MMTLIVANVMGQDPPPILLDLQVQRNSNFFSAGSDKLWFLLITI